MINKDKFNRVVAAARKRTNDKRWLRAIERAEAGILSGELIVTTLAHGALVTSPRGTYYANGHCTCAAAKNGHRECYHRAAARLIEMYESAPEQKPARQPVITRSIEQNYGHRFIQVVRCDGWMI